MGLIRPANHRAYFTPSGLDIRLPFHPGLEAKLRHPGLMYFAPSGLCLNHLPEFYVNAYESYAKSKWNTSSIEFYKFTERYVTYHTNRRFKEFKNYYGDKNKKLLIASRCLPPKIKFEYIHKVRND